MGKSRTQSTANSRTKNAAQNTANSRPSLHLPRHHDKGSSGLPAVSHFRTSLIPHTQAEGCAEGYGSSSTPLALRGRWSRRGFLRTAITATAAASLASCAAIDPANPAHRRPGEIRVGSALFPESEIIARVWAHALQTAGHTVNVVPQIGARSVYLAALQEGSIDIVPEYSGNLATYYGTVPAGADSQAVLAALERNLPQNLEVFAPAAAESKDAYRILRSVSEETGVRSLQDVARWAQQNQGGVIRIGGTPELVQQSYGPDGLAKVYAVDREALDVVVYGDSGGPLTIRALADGVVDMADIYTTTPVRDPSGQPVDVVTLEDPKRLISSQNVVVLARRGVVDESARRVLEGVAARLNTDDLTAMNMRSSGEEKAGADLIARDWLSQR